MLVSVIIPNYNHASFLKQRIDSVLHQTYKDFEVIILDDHSTDNSADIINQYRDHPKINTIVYNEENGGNTFRQWYKGISLSHGELIWIAESDDWCEPIFLETLVRGFNNNEHCVMAFCQSFCVDENNNILWQSKHSRLSEYVNGNMFFQKRLVQGCTIFNVSMGMFRKKYFEAAARNITSFRMCGDWLFWINMSAFGDVYISGRVLNYFRKHTANVGSKVYRSGLNFIEDLKVLYVVKKTNRAASSLLNNIVFIKYNNFLRKKNTFKPPQVRRIMKAFTAWFGSEAAFAKYIFTMRIQKKFNEVRGKVKQLLHL